MSPAEATPDKSLQRVHARRLAIIYTAAEGTCCGQAQKIRARNRTARHKLAIHLITYDDAAMIVRLILILVLAALLIYPPVERALGGVLAYSQDGTTVADYPLHCVNR
jgi:hypothetical protein